MAREQLKPEGYDPLTYVGDMEMSKHAWLGMFNLHEVVLMAAGALGLVGFFLPWLTYQAFGEPRSIFGYDFSRDVEVLRPHPEIWLVPMVSIFFLGRSLLVAQLRKRTKLPLWPMVLITFILSFVLFAIPVIIELDVDRMLTPVMGVHYLNNAEVGWYLAIVAGILAIVGSVGTVVEPFVSKHYTKKGSNERTMRFGMAFVPTQYMAAQTGEGDRTSAAPPDAAGTGTGAPSFDYAGAQPEGGGAAPGYDMGAGWGGAMDPSMMSPADRKKYEKAMKRYQKEQAKRMKQWQKQQRKQQKMYGGSGGW